MFRWTMGFVVAAGLLLVGASGVGAQSLGYANVTAIHGLPDTVVDVFVDGERVIDDFGAPTILGFDDVVGPLVLTADTHSVEVRSGDGAGVVVAATDVDLSEGGAFALVVHQRFDGAAPGEPALTLFDNSYEQPAAGLTEIVVRHVADAGPVDASYSGEPAQIVGLAHGGSASIAVSGGTMSSLDVFASGTYEPVLAFVESDFDAGTKFFAYLVGSTDSGDVRLVFHPWEGMASSAAFQAALTGGKEVPPVSSAGSGLATFALNDEDSLDFFVFAFGLSDIVGAHIHVGSPGEVGAVAVDLLDGAVGPLTGDGLLVSGTITPDDLVAVPDEGYDGSMAELVRMMRRGIDEVDMFGELYVNVHTETHPAGEVRGPIGAVDGSVLAPFGDIGGSVHEESIVLIANAGITKGCSAGLYCPGDFITRGQMAAFLRRAFHLPASPIDAFVDDDASIFEGDVDAIAAFAITAGCNPPDNDQYCPADLVTRAQMAALVRRAFGLPDQSVDFFTDDDASVFENDINAVAGAGITKGCNPPDNDRYCPSDYVTRAQMASFIARALGWS